MSPVDLLGLAPEQQLILSAPGSLKVVTAGPGTGKTRLFVAALEKFRRERPRPDSGIAALSFTNVARDEITSRLEQASAIDFIGTLDSFFLRFVIKPFGKIVGIDPKGYRLVPAAIAGQYDDSVQIGSDNKHRGFLYTAQFTGVDGETPTIKIRTGYGTEEVHPQYRGPVLNAKRKLWNKGILTHSDTHLLAALILLHATHGPYVIKLLSRRFGAILVDELQDTQFFLGRSLLALYSSGLFSGLLVGDPNQAIYEFSGADPGLIDKLGNLSAAVPKSLPKSHRCSDRVCSVANALKVTATEIAAVESGSGRAVMLVHTHKKDDFGDATFSYVDSTFQSFSNSVVLARRNETLEVVLGNSLDDGFPGTSRLPRRLQRAASLFFQGRPKEARQLIEADLCQLAFGKRYVSTDDLDVAGLTSEGWRIAVAQTLFGATQVIEGEDWATWLQRMKSLISTTLSGLSLDQSKVSSAMKKSQGLDALRTLGGPPKPRHPWPATTKLLTVHDAKGLGFDAVAYYIPKPTSKDGCVSAQWWNAQEEEERRIAFVAASRARYLFMLCVHEETYTQLQSTQAEFVGLFELVTVA